MPLKKQHSLSELKELIAGLRRAGKTVALANGCFDLIHVGHIRYLQAAKKEADVLVVAINSDNSLRELKGNKRGFFSEQERALMIAGLHCVDYVILFDEPTVASVLIALRPDYHCKGTDYTPETVPERDVVASYGGSIRIVGPSRVNSTTGIIQAISGLKIK